MERLTDKHYTGDGYYMKCSGRLRCEDNCGECDQLDEVIDRLGAYEDTGLEPEEVGELAQLERECRLVVLPCNVGDVLWGYIEQPKERIYSFLVTDVSWLNGLVSINTDSMGVIPERVIGEKFFRTREEAERVLGGK